MATNRPTPEHDLLRILTSDPLRADVLLRENLPKDVTAQFADEPPEPLPGTYVDEEVRATQCDRLFRVALASGGEAFVYVQLQHGSHPDPKTTLRLEKSRRRIWQEYAGDDASKLRTLPPVIPLVLYVGEAPWEPPPMSGRGVVS